MVDFKNLPKPIWRLMKLPRFFFRIGLRPKFVLLLTTIGRKSGHPRVTPLQYEDLNGIIYVGSARGPKADWYQNLLINPEVTVQLKSQRFVGEATPIQDPNEIMKFLQVRLKNHPRMVGAMLKAEGLSSKPNDVELKQFSETITLVAIKRKSKD
ncbi:nitroreductase family deazaflavin-dependent oxidoreductase [Candidatus Hodarchaeum mangrovi]